MSQINFRYSPFEEDICVVGGKGRGKTTRVKWILSLIKNLPYWVYDFNSQYTGFGSIVHKVKDLKVGQMIFQPYDKSYDTFIKFCNKAFTQRNLVLVFEEIHQYVTKQRACPELYSVVMTGRNYGLSSIFVSTRPASLPNWILSNSNHCFAYGLNNMGDIVWLNDYIGDKAWLLLPPDKRKKLQTEPPLQLHSCIYRNQLETESYIFG